MKSTNQTSVTIIRACSRKICFLCDNVYGFSSAIIGVKLDYYPKSIPMMHIWMKCTLWKILDCLWIGSILAEFLKIFRSSFQHYKLMTLILFLVVNFWWIINFLDIFDQIYHRNRKKIIYEFLENESLNFFWQPILDSTKHS